MSFKISETATGSAVATSGTITFSYPENTSAGSYTAFGHKLWVDKFQRLLSSPTDFTVAFGASTITVTYLGATSIPAGAQLSAQFNIEGKDNAELETRIQENEVKRTILMNSVEIKFGAPDAADADGYVVSQDLTTAGVFSVNTTAAAAIAAAALRGTADVPRNVVAAWTGTAVLTVTGTDEYGKVLVESSASGTSFTGKKAFKTVTSISTSANITALTVGTADVLGLPFFVGDSGQIRQELQDGLAIVSRGNRVYLTGTILEAAVDAGTPFNIVSPVAGNITRLQTISAGTITTGGTITAEVNTVAVAGLSVVIADGAVEGEVDSDTPTLGNSTTAVAVGDRIEIIPSAAFNASADLYFALEIEPTNGRFVAGVSSTATATTGDVRGTYDPTTVCNGSVAFDLIIVTADPTYLGVPQFAG
jgi:hypothetical protein